MEPSFGAFSDELEKIAAGPRVFHDPTLLTHAGLAGKYIAPEVIHSADPRAAMVRSAVAAHGKPIKPGQGFLAMAPLEQIRSSIAKPERTQAVYNATRRHEMTHWLRGKRGLMRGLGEPGLMNVARTAREELAAQLSGLKARGMKEVPLIDKLKSLWVGVPGSVRAAYPQGVMKAVLRR